MNMYTFVCRISQFYPNFIGALLKSLCKKSVYYCIESVSILLSIAGLKVPTDP